MKRIVLLMFVCLCVSAQGKVFDTRVWGLQDFMANATVRLNINKELGSWTGTGFFYRFQNGKKPLQAAYVVLTARHLIDGACSVEMTIPTSENGTRVPTKRVVVTYEKKNIRMFNHPDPAVDIGAILISGEIDRLRSIGTEPYICALDETYLADDAFYSNERQLDPVVMVGYPDGMVDDVNLQPIFRRGVYATAPSLDYQGKKEFLLDIPNYGGSSGSPVFRFDEGMFNNRGRGCGTTITMGSRLVLAGISYDGIGCAPERKETVIVAGAPNSVAWVIKVQRIRELEAAFLSAYGEGMKK